MYVRICVCTYVCVCTYMYVRMCICVWVCIQVYMRINAIDVKHQVKDKRGRKAIPIHKRTKDKAHTKSECALKDGYKPYSVMDLRRYKNGSVVPNWNWPFVITCPGIRKSRKRHHLNRHLYPVLPLLTYRNLTRSQVRLKVHSQSGPVSTVTQSKRPSSESQSKTLSPFKAGSDPGLPEALLSNAVLFIGNGPFFNDRMWEAGM